MKVSRYLETKLKDTIEMKSLDTDDIYTKALNKEKQLEKLSKMEEEMVKRNSESVQVSL